MPAITVSGVSKGFRGQPALPECSFHVEAGRTLALFGPAACGKTTLLRLVAGLETPDSGTIQLEGQEVSRPGSVLAPERRGVGMVFQDLALWPHLTAGQHLDRVLRRHVAKRATRRERVETLLREVGLQDEGAKRPHELSGGQRQCLAMARALCGEPRILLLDEAFSSLDAARRTLLVAALRARAAGGTAILFATHSEADVVEVCDSVLEFDGAAVRVVPLEGWRGREG